MKQHSLRLEPSTLSPARHHRIKVTLLSHDSDDDPSMKHMLIRLFFSVDHLDSWCFFSDFTSSKSSKSRFFDQFQHWVPLRWIIVDDHSLDYQELHQHYLFVRTGLWRQNRSTIQWTVCAITHVATRHLSADTKCTTNQQAKFELICFRLHSHHTVWYHCQSCATGNIDDHSWKWRRSHSRSRKIFSRSRWRFIRCHSE